MKEETGCPECGGSLIRPNLKNIYPMGTGKTYSQKKMWPFSIRYEIVCNKCGLVIDQRTRKVER